MKSRGRSSSVTKADVLMLYGMVGNTYYIEDHKRRLLPK